MIKRALIVDCETTGVDDSAELIEIGMILYSVEHQTTLQEFSSLIPNSKGNPVEHINRIPSAALRDLSSPSFKAACVDKDSAEVYVAHNAEFDRRFFPQFKKPWLCTMSDFKWPRASRERESLVSLALAHGIGVSSAHRALTDCRLIAKLFDRMPNLQEMFRVAMRPKGTFQALVSYDDRELAHAAGFAWNRVDKRWTRRMAFEDAALLGFKVQQLEGV